MKEYQFDLEKANTREFFNENGFALFRNIFSNEEVMTMRKQMYEIFNREPEFTGDWNDKPLIKALRADLFNRYPQLRWIFYKPEIHEALKKVLGDDIGFVPESVAHYKGFGNWHKDTTSQENDGVKIQYEKDWLMVECAIYLQDNDLVYGGGLDVVPGTHKKMSDDFTNTKGFGVISRLINKVNGPLVQKTKSEKGYHIPSKAGDFVFFNKKLDHRSSPCKEQDVPKDKEKLAIFFIAGINNQHLRNYTEYIKTRPSYVYMKGYVLDPAFKNDCQGKGINLIDPAVGEPTAA